MPVPSDKKWITDINGKRLHPRLNPQPQKLNVLPYPEKLPEWHRRLVASVADMQHATGPLLLVSMVLEDVAREMADVLEGAE